MVNKEEIQQNLKDQESWTRALKILIVIIAAQIVELIVFCIVILQLISRLLIRKRFENLDNLSRSLANYTKDVICYITFSEDKEPFPFSDWEYKEEATVKS